LRGGGSFLLLCNSRHHLNNQPIFLFWGSSKTLGDFPLFIIVVFFPIFLGERETHFQRNVSVVFSFLFLYFDTTIQSAAMHNLQTAKIGVVVLGLMGPCFDSFRWWDGGW
jgi:hypothetical protein